MNTVLAIYAALLMQLWPFPGPGRASFASGLNTVNTSRGWETASDPTGWTETDAGSLLSIQNSAQAHSGTYSMSVAGGATTAAYETYDTGATRASASICFWFYAPSTASGGDDNAGDIFQFGSSSIGTYGVKALFRKVAGPTYNFGFRGTSLVYGTASITPGAWYRLEFAFAQNASSTMTIYNAAGSTVDTINVTANNNASRYLYLGKSSVSISSSWTTSYFDDLGIDWTDATTPLWPFTVSD